jgi:proline dehydrogenase
MRAAGRGRGLTIVQPAEPYAQLTLDESWAQPEEHLSHARRGDLSRARRRAEQIGPVVAEIHTPDLHELPALLDTVFEVEAAATKSNREPETHRLQRVVFFRRYAQAACIEATLRVCLLRVGSRVAAVQLAVELGGTYWVLMSHEDKRLADCLPAQLLTRETIRCAAESHLGTYAFWGCAPTHARGWPVTQRPCVALRTYPLGARGLAALAADAAGGQRLRLEQAGRRLWRGTKQLAARCAWPLERVARVYVAGTKLEHALRAADKFAESNLRSTIAYWDARNEAPRRIADVYLAALRSLSGRRQAWLSIKASSLNFSRELVGELVEAARTSGVGLQFDANVLEAVEPTRELLASFLASGARLGWTLPGCWKRSVEDAAWAASGGITVRVVKAPWPDPADPKADRHEGFLGVVDTLAGAAPRVVVGTHDLALVDEAVRRLRTAGSDCQLELLYGWPMRRSLEQAQRLGLSVSVCVPFGKSYLPHALSQLRTDPRHAWWLVRGSRVKPRSAADSI